MNKVMLIGNLTRAPELRYTQNKKPYAKFTIACGYSQRNPDDTYEQAADFVSCCAWGKIAETITKYFCKGSRIAVGGKVRTGSYEKDGEKKYVMDILVNEFTFAGSKVSEVNSELILDDEYEGEDVPYFGDGEPPEVEIPF